MKTNKPFDENDFVRDLLNDTDREIEIEPCRLASEVLTRIERRRRGLRRIVGSAAALFAVALFCAIPFVIRTNTVVESNVVQLRDSNKLTEQVADIQKIQQPSQDEWLNELKQMNEKLGRLKNEMTHLLRLEAKHELALRTERLSRTIALLENPYPVFIGE